MIQILPPTAIAVIFRFKSLIPNKSFPMLGSSGAVLRRAVQGICYQFKNCRQADAPAQ